MLMGHKRPFPPGYACMAHVFRAVNEWQGLADQRSIGHIIVHLAQSLCHCA